MLKLNNITKSFPTVYNPVLNGINLELAQGDFCIVIGANGSGKSTLMKVIAGEHNIDNGSLFINGEDYTGKPRTKLIAQVIQDVNKATIAEMSLLENIALSKMRNSQAKFAFYNRHEKSIIEIIKNLDIGLENYINQPIGNLSGGQRQMIATLMAINSYPKILLLDEHTSALDPKMQEILMDYTAKAIAKHKLTSMMITHKMEDVIKYGNRLIMLHHGKIIFDIAGPEKDAITKQKLISLFQQYEHSTLENINDN